MGGSGVDVKIGGVTAALEDQSNYMKGRMPVFIAAVVGLSFLLLLARGRIRRFSAHHRDTASLARVLMQWAPTQRRPTGPFSPGEDQ